MIVDISKLLIGKDIGNNWKIIASYNPQVGLTGGTHSVGFIAENSINGKRAFVKVLYPMYDPDLSGIEQTKDSEFRLSNFNYETDLLIKCRDRNMHRIVTCYDRSEIQIPTLGYPIHYLLFEFAEQNLRELNEIQKILNYATKLNIIHKVSLALESLHYNNIFHQDIKPSNILSFDNGNIKLSDLGHAHDDNNRRPAIINQLGGDPAHAPPEILYGSPQNKFPDYCRLADLYLLGSIVVYLFTNTSLTSQINLRLNEFHKQPNWPGTYFEVLPYIIDSWEDSIIEFSESISESFFQEDLEILVRYLTNPNTEKRGHPRNLAGKDNPYGIRRFSSQFQNLAKKAELNLKRH